MSIHVEHKQLKGLTSQEVLESRQKYGVNVLTPPVREPWWKLYLEKFEDPIIRILLIAACIAFIVGIAHSEYAEPIGIVVAIFLATTMAFINEYKAGKEFDILNKVNDDVEYKVIRDGGYQSVPKKDLVVGDIILLELGEEIPIDASIIEAVSLQVDESSLTGESEPAPKYASGNSFGIHFEGKQTAYPPDRVYRGTMVQDGHGIMKATAVGDSTEIGKTATEAAEESDEETPLNRQLDNLSKVIGVAGFGIAGLLFIALSVHASVVGEIVMTTGQWIFTGTVIVTVMIALVRVWLPIVYDFFEVTGKEKERPEWLEAEGLKPWGMAFGYGALFFIFVYAFSRAMGIVPMSLAASFDPMAGGKFLQFFMIAITLIVVAVPEGLAMSVTLSLAYSMRKMTATNNLVRKMHACETIGAATVICTDKTGTLTMNKMSVFETHFPSLEQSPKLIYDAMAVNTTANLSKKSDGETEALGNPTDCALLLWLDKTGINYDTLRDAFNIEKQLTFSTERKYMATMGWNEQGVMALHVKGAPEIVLDKCSNVLTETGVVSLLDEEKQNILDSIRSYQARGMRALGFAWREVTGELLEKDKLEDIAEELTWLGFTAIADPVRSDVPDAIRACADAGIKVKIVTGDNQETAKEIGRQIGLIREGDDLDKAVMTGNVFESLSDKELKEAVKDLKILSRARPLHKLRLVKTLQEAGEIVAVTGDGTNDAPALNHANVGLSMGKNGTAVAKEASDIVLLDDSFKSIVSAIMWGRSLYQNIQRFILFQLTVNVAALIIALMGPFIGIELPLTVTQMLWVNLIMDTFAALALATEPPHWEVMKNKPRDPSAFIVTPQMSRGIFGYGLAFVVILASMLMMIQSGGVSPYELTVFFSVFVMLQFWNLFNARCLGLTTSAFSGLIENKGFVYIALVIFIGQILMVQFGGAVFRTVPLSAMHWLMIIVGTSLVLWIGEALRFWNRKMAKVA